MARDDWPEKPARLPMGQRKSTDIILMRIATSGSAIALEIAGFLARQWGK